MRQRVVIHLRHWDVLQGAGRDCVEANESLVHACMQMQPACSEQAGTSRRIPAAAGCWTHYGAVSGRHCWCPATARPAPWADCWVGTLAVSAWDAGLEQVPSYAPAPAPRRVFPVQAPVADWGALPRLVQYESLFAGLQKPAARWDGVIVWRRRLSVLCWQEAPDLVPPHQHCRRERVLLQRRNRLQLQMLNADCQWHSRNQTHLRMMAPQPA